MRAFVIALFAAALLALTPLKVAFCASENQADVYSMFCEQFFPLWLTESYSRSNYFAAQAMANMPEGIYGILFCLDTYDEGDVWYQIVLHVFSFLRKMQIECRLVWQPLALQRSLRS